MIVCCIVCMYDVNFFNMLVSIHIAALGDPPFGPAPRASLPTRMSTMPPLVVAKHIIIYKLLYVRSIALGDYVCVVMICCFYFAAKLQVLRHHVL